MNILASGKTLKLLKGKIGKIKTVKQKARNEIQKQLDLVWKTLTTKKVKSSF